LRTKKSTKPGTSSALTVAPFSIMVLTILVQPSLSCACVSTFRSSWQLEQIDSEFVHPWRRSLLRFGLLQTQLLPCIR
jgi:hypothetical protein